jgi:hypothetical protein
MHALLLLAADPAPADQVDWLNLSDPTSVVRIIGLLIPILTALVTKHVASQGLKSVVTLVLSAVTAAVAVLVSADGGFAWQAFVNAFINAFVPAIAIYYGLWKPTGVAGSVAAATKTFGLGSPPTLETAAKGEESPDSAAGDPHAGEGGLVAVGSLALLLVVLGAVGLLAGLLLPNHMLLVVGVIVLVLGVVIGFAGGRRNVV